MGTVLGPGKHTSGHRLPFQWVSSCPGPFLHPTGEEGSGRMELGWPLRAPGPAPPHKLRERAAQKPEPPPAQPPGTVGAETSASRRVAAEFSPHSGSQGGVH